VIPAGFKKVIREIGTTEKKKLGEICFIFVSEKEIIRINREFLQHNYLTDVITFGNNNKNTTQGDIFICPDAVFENAEIYQTSRLTEIFRVMVHGVLHLAGYADRTDEEKVKMRSMEDYYLVFWKEMN